MSTEIKKDLKELDRYLKKINSIFPTKNLINETIDIRRVKKYYRDSCAGYKYLHSKEGAVHMALNYDGKYDNEGFYTQVKEINEIIESKEIKNVLELGCGKGFNSIYLASKNSKTNFIGIDITNEHLLIANQKSNDIENLEFSYGDFHNLDFQDSSFDLVFELESICHASDSKQVLSEIYRILKSGGQFVLYEGFKKEGFENLPRNLIDAAILTEKAMAVHHFEKIDYWLNIATNIGFNIKLNNELSEAIMPNLGRFQYLARGYYHWPLLSKIFLRILPKDMVMNSIAGLLMPFTVHNNAHGYYKIILEK